MKNKQNEEKRIGRVNVDRHTLYMALARQRPTGILQNIRRTFRVCNN